ncbi:hypothetical protein [Mycobacterium heckeshornense]|nr:hypothetical protein [Mycobacterium heckeshornense]
MTRKPHPYHRYPAIPTRQETNMTDRNAVDVATATLSSMKLAEQQ